LSLTTPPKPDDARYLTDETGPGARVSYWNRSRKWDLFLREVPFEPSWSVLDCGFSELEYSASDNWLERHYPYQSRITALSLDLDPVQHGEIARDVFARQQQAVSRRYPDVQLVTYAGGTMPFDDGSFDLCWSNAVLEHVGDDEQQVAFLREIRRVARHGFVSTPARAFPIEVHTRLPVVHWLPKVWCDRALSAVGRSWATGDYLHLLTRRELERALRAAEIAGFRVHTNRLAGAPLDYVAIW
jgi:hypothetical protein